MAPASLAFVDRAENVVFIGDPDTGKTGLAIGLLRQALVSGRRGRFYKAQDLSDELYASLADTSTPKLFKRLAGYDLLVIDELGYLTLNPEQVNAFFKLMDERYSRKSTLITTNLDYPQWYDLFKRKPLVDALLDRLEHRCITIRISGPSLRVPDETQPLPELLPLESPGFSEAWQGLSSDGHRLQDGAAPELHHPINVSAVTVNDTAINSSDNHSSTQCAETGSIYSKHTRVNS